MTRARPCTVAGQLAQDTHGAGEIGSGDQPIDLCGAPGSRVCAAQSGFEPAPPPFAEKLLRILRLDNRWSWSCLLRRPSKRAVEANS